MLMVSARGLVIMAKVVEIDGEAPQLGVWLPLPLRLPLNDAFDKLKCEIVEATLRVLCLLTAAENVVVKEGEAPVKRAVRLQDASFDLVLEYVKDCELVCELVVERCCVAETKWGGTGKHTMYSQELVHQVPVMRFANCPPNAFT